MSVATMSPEMRQVGPSRVTTVAQKAGMQSLVISPNLDALLEHDERIRRAAQYAARAESPSVLLPSQGLPPPPRRPRAPGSPSQLFAPPLPPSRSPLVAQEERDLANTPDSNPYINPAPQWVEVSPTPISPPPRSSSMGIEFDAARPRGASLGSVRVGGNGDSSSGVDASTTTDDISDSRYPRPFLPKSPSLPRLLKWSPPKDRDNDEPPRVLRRRSRSRGKPQLRGTDSPPQMSEIMPEQRLQARRRSERSISVSSAISTDRESFIDLFSPSNQDFPTDFTTGPFTAASPTPSNFPPRKPPVPTTPKPDFRRRTTTPVPTPQRRPSPNPVGPPSIPVRALPPDSMPPTTNFLNPSERAQLIKKSRKLAQVFGQTPGAADLVADPAAGARSSFLDVAGPSTSGGGGSGRGSRVRHRAAASMNMVGQMPPAQRPLPPWPAAEKTIKMTIDGRRHSTSSSGGALVSDGASVMTTEFAMPSSEDGGPSSPRSFMDFSNNGSNSNEDEGDAEVGPDDSISVFLEAQATPLGPRSKSRTAAIPPSPSSPSLFENMTPEEQAEEERRKKRDKLAKLHRFLGSRVPTSLVLGLGQEHNSMLLNDVLPPPQIVVGMDGTLDVAGNESFLRGGGNGTGTGARGASWVKRRRSSSAAILSTWSDDLDRVKEDLNEKEKAIIVRRAQKMEKVFGVAPPQMLYSAHHGHSPTASASGSGSGSGAGAGSAHGTPPASPPASYGYSTASGYAQILAPGQSRNPNQAPYMRSSSNPAGGSGSGSGPSRSRSGSGHTRKSHNGRPGTGDSGTFLLADAEPSAGSFVYTHYQHSLNSLHDIIDRNDKESLAELHQYLNDASASAPPISPLEFSGSSNGSVNSGSGSGSGSGGTGGRPKAERRRSLPARTSIASLASYASAASLASLASVNTVTTGPLGASGSPDAGGGILGNDDFQQRRKRAAKLTQFFGVDYRDLIEDVLESIEHGLDAERRRGTLNPAEAEALLQKLRTLKARR
ncbi:hypothetical protein C8F04DRAFT_492885 [Mycena alexandri]|uniref:Uncharacterized protein n=1 Tax=Mycena alexandri TaxID=1745969 RepID=A0AAD6RWU3_9AGAR|nr:hypothetical protein C8F04DRAFT_492885 [Mycena alexandri]